MKFGICVGSEKDRIKCAADSGYDYVESRFAFFANSDDQTIDDYCATIAQYNLKCEAVNCFLPGTMKVVGDEIDYDALKDYIERGMKNGVKAGLEMVVFGSGGARSLPDGFPYEKGIRQLVYFLKEIVAPIAQKYDITVVIEPLSKKDTNIISTVKEGCMLAAMAESENIKGLSDSYHMCAGGDSFDNIRDVKGFLGHAHVAEPSERVFPYEGDGADYRSYIEALEFAGCPRCSVEASTTDFLKDAPIAIKVLKDSIK